VSRSDLIDSLPIHSRRQPAAWTLRGPVPVDQLGKVLIHEHVFNRVRSQFQPDALLALREHLDALVAAGIGTIVDVTPYVAPGPFVRALRDHPLNIICCVGYYVERRVPRPYRSQSQDALAARLIRSFERGIGATAVRPGIIKVASGGAIPTPFERRAFAAAAIANRATGLPIMTHATHGGEHQLEIMLGAGADARRIVLSHMEMMLKGRDAQSFDAVFESIRRCFTAGANGFFNDFGTTDSAYRRDVLRLVRALCREGFAGQILIGSDSHWTVRSGRLRFRGGTRLGNSGARTYAFTQQHIVPLLLQNGFTSTSINSFLTSNPARILGVLRA